MLARVDLSSVFLSGNEDEEEAEEKEPGLLRLLFIPADSPHKTEKKLSFSTITTLVPTSNFYKSRID